MEWSHLFEIGFLMGLLGSVHCIGMCGPLVMALPLSNKTNLQKWGALFLYHFGKICSYSLLGVLLGLFGSQLPLYGVQENLSIVMGSIMVLYVVYVFIIKSKKTTGGKVFFNFLYTPIVKKLADLFKQRNNSSY